MSEPTTPCTCGCSRSRHTDDGKCHGRNADDTGTCRCTAFHEAPGDAPVTEEWEVLANALSEAFETGFISYIDIKEKRFNAFATEVVPFLAESGYTIAPRGDVLTSEDRAAIGRWLSIDEQTKEQHYKDLDRLRALANGGTA